MKLHSNHLIAWRSAKYSLQNSLLAENDACLRGLRLFTRSKAGDDTHNEAIISTMFYARTASRNPATACAYSSGVCTAA
jgi:hypothetical protein